MLFTAHAARVVEEEQMDRLGEMLGIVWTREAAQALETTPDAEEMRKPRERMVIPLLAGMNPKIIDMIRKSFGSQHGIDAPGWYRHNKGEVVEAFSMPRDEFIKMASMFLPLVNTVKDQNRGFNGRR